MRENGKFGLDKTTRSFFYLCTAFCVSFFLWASVSPLDIVSNAMGEVIPSSRVKRIQHLEGGIVHEIKVREGEKVAAGQPLIVLEATASDSTVEEINVRINSLRTEIARLEAESRWYANLQDGSDNATAAANTGGATPPNADISAIEPQFPEDLPQVIIAQARDLYNARRDRFVSDINGQKEKIKQRQQDINEIVVRIRNQRQSLEYLREQIRISEDLLKEKLTTRYKHLGFLKEESNLVSRIQEDAAALARSKSALAAADDALDKIYGSHHEEVQEALRKARREVLEFTQRLRKTTDSLQRTVIRAPIDGIVKTVYVRGVGEVVQPGMTVLDIVPAGDKLIIEAHLALGDIGYVQPGQPATVTLPNRDARMFGKLEGKVTNISPDAVTVPEQGTFYKVLVETRSDRFEKEGRRYQLYPGMRLLVAIKTGERTVMEYLLYPYFDTLYHGFHER
ncbi:HlyD family type I secretion periplasmic adaptor subunit [Pseudodesulfovibrio sp.]|uniref:HlyD family type I secretion periplasmic adaptor subunit n=1 Tax=Pseudodesulfovibrio sp. TaxID=2035812 RepID=UPI002634F232|nr:HlyD family type I secretion periplasmic adaptor subunit [Pseudodesulfovibrio sp.]MDD3313716.1 HlyD family type I secretion periplasmic adaptor subunit [Pseudodesulfovibrio sp.]